MPNLVKKELSRSYPESYIRCLCGKIVSQLSNDSIIIKCRHCKQFVVIKAQKIERIDYRQTINEEG
ncbi:hypothetical protein [Calderihabitans maritimus]|uniref:hypothetical protein n=1 Tax=Calderihabitans maritimus TaxID=1246530 RepID=UPI000B50DA9F|nr:hypothetical protein [Calderihabitans maritimus]